MANSKGREAAAKRVFTSAPVKEVHERDECISAAQICLLEENGWLARDLVKPQHLEQDDKDSDAEVDGPEGLGLGNRGQGNAALARGQDERVLALEEEISDGTVQRRDEQA